VKIALDFDGTYTRAPQFWNGFVEDALDAGHEVRIVTFRKSTMTDPALDWLAQQIPVIYTEYQQKRAFCRRLGWEPDIWIDDQPEFIVEHVVLVGD
jgi:hypothetical protein